MSLHYLFQQYVLQSVARAAGQVVGIGGHIPYIWLEQVYHIICLYLFSIGLQFGYQCFYYH